MVEAGTDYNFVRDGVFQGNEKAYDVYANVTETVATVGSLVLGGYHTTGQYKAAKYGQKFLGKGYDKVAKNRWVSNDGLRQMKFDNTHHILDGVITTNHFNLTLHGSSIFNGRSEILKKVHVFYNFFNIWIR